MTRRDWIYGGCIALLCIALFHYYDRSTRFEQESNNKSSIIKEKEKQIKYRTNENGRILAQNRVATATVRELQEAYPELIDEIKKEFDIKIKNITAVVRKEFKATGSGEAQIIHNYYHNDSSKQYPRWTLRASDQYLDFTAEVDTVDQQKIPFTYTYTDTITTVVSQRRKNIFSRETLFSTTKFQNKNSRIINSENVRITNYKDKRWALVVGFGYGVGNNGLTPTVNVTIGREIFKF